MKSLPMEAGDTIFFHPLLIHGSGPNRSEKTRKVYWNDDVIFGFWIYVIIFVSK